MVQYRLLTSLCENVGKGAGMANAIAWELDWRAALAEERGEALRRFCAARRQHALRSSFSRLFAHMRVTL